jgi:GST-like protein
MESINQNARMVVHNPDVIQLYSAATPNGMKVAAMLEELVVLRGLSGEEFNYEPHTVDIRRGENRKESFKLINPNAKIPVIRDPHGPTGNRVSVFESGAILLYLAEKFGELLPVDPVLKLETQKWLFFGSSNVSPKFKLFGFYFKYCPHKMPYCLERYAKEVDRLLGVLEHQLSDGKHWIVGNCYTIADLSIWPWVYALKENYDNAAIV